jgi:flagellar FliL protein
MKEKMSGRMLTPPTPGTLYPMESFLVNISSDQGPKFLQTQMEFELMDAATEDEISKKKSAIRDAIIVLLSSRSYKQIRDTSGMVNLRRDLLRVVNNLLTTGQVREVYFTQFHFN